jgi:hypothetical protein
MPTVVTTINLSNPDQDFAGRDRYHVIYDDASEKTGTFRDLSFPRNPRQGPIRYITTKAFYRRMTQGERTTLRGSTDENINDLRDDLKRSPIVHLDDPGLIAMMQATPLTAQRITELLSDGTPDETEQ